MKRSPMPKRRTFLSRSGPPKRANRARRTSEFARCYGSKERVEWIKTLPCCVTHACQGPIENVHAVGGGSGRKADARWVIPMCQAGHRELHRIGVRSFEAKYALSLDVAASVVEELWQSHLARQAL